MVLQLLKLHQHIRNLLYNMRQKKVCIYQLHNPYSLCSLQLCHLKCFHPILYSIYLLSCVVSRESLTPVSNFNSSLPSQHPIPSIKEFLEKLDKDEGSNGDFIQFIDAFNEQKISVKHIKDLDDDEFQMLGVRTIGWRKTILAAAKQY